MVIRYSVIVFCEKQGNTAYEMLSSISIKKHLFWTFQTFLCYGCYGYSKTLNRGNGKLIGETIFDVFLTCST